MADEAVKESEPWLSARAINAEVSLILRGHAVNLARISPEDAEAFAASLLNAAQEARQFRRNELVRKRARIDAELAAIDQTIARLDEGQAEALK